jgi:curli biogenesis system outer membrane secretion channel CsgG
MRNIKLVWVFLLLVSLVIGQIYAKKLKIAVAPFENKSSYPYSVSPLRDLVINALFKTGKFAVFEREKLEVLLQEKKLAKTGLVENHYQSQFSGVDALLFGVVTQFGRKSIKKGGLGGTLKWGILGGQKKDVVEVTLNLRLIDVNTGQILAVGQATARRKIKKGLAVGLFNGIPLGWGKLGSDNTLIAQAIKEVVQKSVLFVKKSLLGSEENQKLESAKDKFLEKYRQKYPEIFGKSSTEKNYVSQNSEEHSFSSANKREISEKYRSKIKVYVAVTQKDDYSLSSQLVSNIILKELERSGYTLVDNPKNSTVQILGEARALPVTEIYTPHYKDDDFKSVTAQVDLKIKSGTKILTAISYQLPKPQLHIREGIAAREALNHVGEIVAQKIINFLNNYDFARISAGSPKKHRVKSERKLFLKVEKINSFSEISHLKQVLKKERIKFSFLSADLEKGIASFSLLNLRNPFSLAEKLNASGWKVMKINSREIVISPSK